MTPRDAMITAVDKACRDLTQRHPGRAITAGDYQRAGAKALSSAVTLSVVGLIDGKVIFNATGYEGANRCHFTLSIRRWEKK